MDVIINSENNLIPKEAEIFSSAKDLLLNLLMRLDYDPLNPPAAQVLSLYHQLKGNWLILSPVQWQVTHKDAMIVAAGKELGLDSKTSLHWFHLYASHLAAEHLSLHYHDPYTWLLQAANKPIPTAKPVYQLLDHSLMPELEQLDTSLYWQKFFTEGQMFFASHSDSPPFNGAWVWGGAPLEPRKYKTVCADEAWFPIAKICADNVTLYNPRLKLKQYSILCINDLTVLSATHRKELEKMPVRWYWNNVAYRAKQTWITRFWRKITHAY